MKKIIIATLTIVFIVLAISSTAYSQKDSKIAGYDSVYPTYPSDSLKGLSKEDLKKAGFDSVYPTYPSDSLKGLSKEDLKKAGFDSVYPTYPSNEALRDSGKKI